MTDALDGLRYEFECQFEEDELSEEGQRIVDKYNLHKDDLIALHAYGQITELTLAELVRMTKLIEV